MSGKVRNTAEEGRIAQGRAADADYQAGDWISGVAARTRQERRAAGGADEYKFGDFTRGLFK